jgi:hypothetical protein
MDWSLLKEMGKGLLFVLTGIFMVPILFLIDWGWERWSKLWGRSRASNGLFILFAPVMLFCFAIAWLFAVRWQSMLTG